MVARGVIPQWHVECDPREHKVWFVAKPHPETTYCIASTCHPKMFARLRRNRVLMWHGYTDDDTRRQVELVENLEPGARLMAGGTNVGMRALSIGLELGYREFHLWGFDCCYGETQWAGDHSGEPHPEVKIEVEGKIFKTSEMMMQSTDDYFNLMPMLRGSKVWIHGGGLLSERLKLYARDPKKALSPDWWRPVDFIRTAA
jgi:hypothetical protein